MDDDTLLTLAAIEDHSAREEILKRHIMDVDEVEYERASETFEVVARRNSELLTSRAHSVESPEPNHSIANHLHRTMDQWKDTPIT